MVSNKFCDAIDIFLTIPRAVINLVNAPPQIYINGLAVGLATTASFFAFKFAIRNRVMRAAPADGQQEAIDFTVKTAFSSLCSIWSYFNFGGYYGLKLMVDDYFSVSSLYLVCFTLGYTLFDILDNGNGNKINLTPSYAAHSAARLLYGLYTIHSKYVDLYNILLLLEIQNIFLLTERCQPTNMYAKYMTVLCKTVLGGTMVFVMYELLMQERIEESIYLFIGLISHLQSTTNSK